VDITVGRPIEDHFFVELFLATFTFLYGPSLFLWAMASGKRERDARERKRRGSLPIAHAPTPSP